MNMMKELDFYDEILDFYENKTENSQENSEFWVLNYLINVMNEYNYNDKEIKNCLILLLNLLVIDSPDRFNNIGKSANSLIGIENKFLLEILFREFID